MPHSKGLQRIPILNRINPIPRIDAYFFKMYSNIVLPSTPTPKGLFLVDLTNFIAYANRRMNKVMFLELPWGGNCHRLDRLCKGRRMALRREMCAGLSFCYRS